VISNSDRIKEYLEKEKSVIDNLDIKSINMVFSVLDDALHNNKTVYTFGNGGSGSTASHMVNDFNKALFKSTQCVFNFRCLNDNIPTLLAVANDISYDDVFLYQLMGRLTDNDVIIAFSGSGNSKNIIKAVEYARKCGAIVIGFTGYDGGSLKKMANYSIDTNISNMQITEDVHLMMEHLLISMFYEKYGLVDNKKLVRIFTEGNI